MHVCIHVLICTYKQLEGNSAQEVGACEYSKQAYSPSNSRHTMEPIIRQGVVQSKQLSKHNSCRK